jgi:folate-binding protein YgfZ
MIADMRAFEQGDRLLLDVAAGQAANLRDRFDQLIFSEDAQVVDASTTLHQLGIYGPQASRAITRALRLGIEMSVLDAMPLYSNRTVESAAGPVLVLRSDDVGVGGFDLLVGGSDPERIGADLREAGAIDVGPDVAETTRIEGGRPLFGIDMDEDTIPLEAGIEDRAISLTNGCYVGQEIIIRVLHRGHGRVARRLTGLVFDPSAAVPSRGDAVRVGEKSVGIVTSATRSPALSRPIAMGYVHRDFAEPSTAVVVVSGGKEQAASVAALPFVERADGPKGPSLQSAGVERGL